MRGLSLVVAIAACSGHGDRASPPDETASGRAPQPRASIDAADAVPPGGAITFVEAKLGTRAPRDDDKADAIVWSSTGRAVAWVDPDGTRQRVVVNGVAQRLFDHVLDLELLPDGTPRYIGNDGGTAGDHGFVSGGTFRVVVGDQLGPPADHAMILHDADHPDEPFHYLASHGMTQSLVVDGHAGPPLSDVSIENLIFLPDRRPTYQAKVGTEEHVVIGDDVGPAYAGTIRPRVSRTGHVAYGARDADGATYAVVDRTPQAHYDDLDGLDMSPDGAVTYEGTRGAARYAVIGARELGPYDRVMDFAFSKAGGHVAFSARKGEQWFVVIDGVQGPPFAGIGGNLAAAVWSDDGQHVAYVAHTGGDVEGPDVVVRDGRRDAAHDEGRDLAWSRDGRHLAYIAKRGDGYVMVVDGASGPPMAEVGPPSFDGAGQVVYEARRETSTADGFPRTDWCIVRGATPACYDDVGEPGMIAGDQDDNFTISPDGRRVAFRARTGERWFVVVDGRAGPPADQLWPPRWSTDGAQVGYGARDGDALWWRVTPMTSP